LIESFSFIKVLVRLNFNGVHLKQKKPTITEIAKTAGVSVSTVDRVLSRRAPVRSETREQVMQAAKQIGYLSGSENFEGNDRKVDSYRFGFLLLQSSRPFYRKLSEVLQEVVINYAGAKVHALVEYLDDLSPEVVAERIRSLGAKVDALGIVAAQHPIITEAIEDLAVKGIPTFALISSLSTPSGSGYVGLDNWKVGRTAGWAFANLCKSPGKIATIVGSHRYRCQELNEIGFRSYLREYAPDFQVLEPLSSHEDSQIAEQLTADLLRQEPDLRGLYISGGGIVGVLRALRETQFVKPLVTIGYELMEETREALLDGCLSLVISHPLQLMASETITAMIASLTEGKNQPLARIQLPFDIYTPENL
jgi:LacI family transcriptional regulator